MRVPVDHLKGRLSDPGDDRKVVAGYISGSRGLLPIADMVTVMDEYIRTMSTPGPSSSMFDMACNRNRQNYYIPIYFFCLISVGQEVV